MQVGTLQESQRRHQPENRTTSDRAVSHDDTSISLTSLHTWLPSAVEEEQAVDLSTKISTGLPSAFQSSGLPREISVVSTTVPPIDAMLATYTGDDKVQRDSWSGEEEGFDFKSFYFHHMSQPQTATILLEDCDRLLFNYLLENVLPLLFPVLEAHQHGSVKADVVLPGLENNKAYLHSCLHASATHMESSSSFLSHTVEDDIMRHKLAFVTIVVEALHNDTQATEILDALLGMITINCCVESSAFKKELIPWYQHFQAAADIAQKLNLPKALESQSSTGGLPTFNMTITAWIDILGSTMLGKAPRFSDTYRNMIFASQPSGLNNLMGCNDSIMYLLSEVACLESLKLEGKVDDIRICGHITSLAQILDSIAPVEHLYRPAQGVSTAVWCGLCSSVVPTRSLRHPFGGSSLNGASCSATPLSTGPSDRWYACCTKCGDETTTC
jgi:hypothetical protein